MIGRDFSMSAEDLKKVSLFIPVYNALQLIKRDLRAAYAALQQLGADFEIVIVDDNSSDGSHRLGRVINRARTVTGRDIRYLRYDNGPSRRENLAKAFYTAKHDIVGFIDADFSCDIVYFMKAMELLNDPAIDMVIGSRYIKGAKAKRRLVRRIFSFFYNLLIRLLFGSTIKDRQCGLKVFRKRSVMPVIEQMGYDGRFIRGWFWDAELLVRAQKAKLKIIEMPVVWVYADSSTFNFKRELKALWAMAVLKLEMMKAKKERP